MAKSLLKKYKRGFTLVEVLVAATISAIVMTVLASCIFSAMRVYSASTALAHTNVVANTIDKAVSSELRYAANVTVSGDNVFYTSRLYGENCEIRVNDDGDLVVECSSGAVPLLYKKHLADKDVYLSFFYNNGLIEYTVSFDNSVSSFIVDLMNS